MTEFNPIPQLPGWPIVGNMPAFKKNRLAVYAEVAERCGDIGGYKIGSLPFVLLNKPEYV